jgi:hypothetical protein
VLTELICRLTDSRHLSVKHTKTKSVTIYKLVNKLYFPSNIIFLQNHWTLHHRLSKHVKINCLYICKFTSRYKTYRWSCGHCVVAYWGRNWLAREIQFVKKKPFRENVQCKSIYKQSQEHAVPGIFSQIPLLQFYSRFSTNPWGNTTVVFLCCNPTALMFLCFTASLWLYHTSHS